MYVLIFQSGQKRQVIPSTSSKALFFSVKWNAAVLVESALENQVLPGCYFCERKPVTYFTKISCFHRNHELGSPSVE